MSRKILTIVLICVIVFGGGLAAILINNAARSFRTVAHTITAEQRFCVSGNGGNAVAVGNYLFFIGGYVPLTDITYRQNEHNRVTYGAIYRVTLGQDGRPTYNNSWLEGWEDRQHMDPVLNAEHYGEKWNTRIATKRLIVPKIAGHEASAMWVFGNHIIYTSPHNRLDRQGRLQSGRLDFFRVDLDGGNHRLIYTSRESGLTRDDFTVAWVNSSSYLLVHDGGRLIRVGISRNLGDETRIANDVTSFAFPIVTNFFTTGSAANTALKGFGGVMDFVYWTENRDTDNGTRVPQGNIMRRFHIANGNRETIGQVIGSYYEVLSVGGGNFFFQIGEWNNGQSRNPVLYIADRTNMSQFEQNFRATNRLLPGELVFTPTEITGSAFRFITLYNEQITLYTRNTERDVHGNWFSRAHTITTNVDEILHVGANTIYYMRGGSVRAVDFHGNKPEAERTFGTPSERIDEINISFFQTLPHAGRDTSREFFFFMTTFSDTTTIVDTEGEEGFVTNETISVPVIIDRDGTRWILANLEERFVI